MSLKQTIRLFLNNTIQVFIGLYFISILHAGQDSYISFENASRYYDFLPKVVALDLESPTSPLIISDNKSWDISHFDPHNKLKNFKDSYTQGINKDIFIHSIIYKNSNSVNDYNDLAIPLVMLISDYKLYQLEKQFYISFKKKLVNSVTKHRGGGVGSSRAITLVSKEVAGQEVSLKIDGNININGQIVFEDKELVGLNQQQSKTWDLDIEQTQRFNIEGTIGDRWSIKAHQDSEADFSWENDLNITYKGKANDILKKMEAGNISLHLPSTQFVNVGSSKSEGLFGIKMVHKLGPLDIQSIVSKEQVKKTNKSLSLESADGNYINAYNYIRDKYYFIDKYFKAQYYPLDDENRHNFQQNYTIIEHEVWKMIDPQNETIQGDKVEGSANVDPNIFNSSTDYENATWVKLTEDIPNDNEVGDYEIDRLLGTIRFNNIRSEDIIAISYKIGKYVSNLNNQFEYMEYSDGDSSIVIVKDYFDILVEEGIDEELILDNGTTLKEDCISETDCYLNMKLLKATNKVSDPSSPTWELMFKNVYNLGSSDISIDGFDLDIIYTGGNLGEETHSELSNASFIKIFNLDKFDQNGNLGSDGKVDYLNSNILNASKGELFFPTYLPFTFEPSPIAIYECLDGNVSYTPCSDGDAINTFPLFWGTDWGIIDSTYYEDLEQYLPELNDNNNDFSDSNDDGPAMYYDLLGSTSIMTEHKFQIKVKHSKSQRSSTYSLGFMIVENSEEVKLNGSKLSKGTDYTIDYFSGTLNIINPQALDPTANIEVSYEENELVSFDQKVLAGIHMKLGFSDNDFLSGGAYYYNQSIIDSKVEIGYEPMRNFLWNINGKYDTDINFLTTLTDMIPLVDANGKSTLNLEGEFAQVFPNPNPLGQAFLDDFEASKQTSSPSILQNKWKLSSPPLLSLSSSNIDCDKPWENDNPDNQPNNNDNNCYTYANKMDITYRGDMYWYNPYVDIPTEDIWPNIETSNRAQNTTTKTLWIGTEGWEDNLLNWNGISAGLYPSDYNQERSKYFDIWIYTSEIQNDSMRLNIDIGYISEDINSNNILDSEDQAVFGNIGNNILDEGEDLGYDGCDDSYENGNGGCLSTADGTFEQICNNIPTAFFDDWRYYVQVDSIPNINYDLCNNLEDPNRDNFAYNEGSGNYNNINGTQGNGSVEGYVYPDTEDLDGDYLQDFNNDYFTYSIQPLIDSASDSTQFNNGNNTGWKLYRINLSDFEKVLPEPNSTVDWNDVRMMRLWVQGSGSNKIGIAKIEIVGSQWEEIGEVSLDQIDNQNAYAINPDFSISVINSDENSNYESPDGVEGEYDEMNEVQLKEQSLVMDFSDSGVASNKAMNIMKVLTYMSNASKDNFFAYEKLKMYINGQPLFTDEWNQDDENINIIFRLGKENEYYEIRQPVYEGWNDLNHIDIDLGELTKKKLETEQFESNSIDLGIDNASDEFEDGCGGSMLVWENSGNYAQTSYLDLISYIYIHLLADLYEDPCLDSIEDYDTCVFEYVWGQSFSADGLIDNNDTSNICPSCSIEEPANLPESFSICKTNNVLDPNNDNWDLANNPEGTQNNGQWDFVDSNDNGSLDESELLYEIPILPDSYDPDLDLYRWTNGIEDICNNCSDFIIKGEPAINRIEHVLVGVANESQSTIYGEIYINELRFTGVKKDPGQAFRLSGSLNFSDLLSFQTQYKREDADFHRLQERLGSGNTTETFSFNTTFHADKFLPSSWGINIPFYLNFSKQNSIPKYYPYNPDVLTGSFRTAPDSIRSINQTVSLSTSFSKNSRSKNWILKNSLDRMNINYSISNQTSSSVTVLSNIKTNQSIGLGYNYPFKKDNYFILFQEGNLDIAIKSIYKGPISLSRNIITLLKNTAFWWVEYTPSLIVNIPILKVITKPASERIAKPLFTMLKDNYKEIILIPFWAPRELLKDVKFKENILSLPVDLVEKSFVASKKAIHVIDNSVFWFSEYIPDIAANLPLINLITHPIIKGFKNIPSKNGVLLKFDSKSEVSENCLSNIQFYDSNSDTIEFGWADSFVDDFNGKWDEGEEFIDNLNGKWDEGEEFVDGNGVWDEGEEFVDGNGVWDEGEEFIDGNGIWDEGEEFIDNLNGVWDEGEEFIDGNGVWDEGEEFIDIDGNGLWNGYCSETNEESKTYNKWLNSVDSLIQIEEMLILESNNVDLSVLKDSLEIKKNEYNIIEKTIEKLQSNEPSDSINSIIKWIEYPSRRKTLFGDYEELQSQKISSWVNSLKNDRIGTLYQKSNFSDSSIVILSENKNDIIDNMIINSRNSMSSNSELDSILNKFKDINEDLIIQAEKMKYNCQKLLTFINSNYPIMNSKIKKQQKAWAKIEKRRTQIANDISALINRINMKLESGEDEIIIFAFSNNELLEEQISQLDWTDEMIEEKIRYADPKSKKAPIQISELFILDNVDKLISEDEEISLSVSPFFIGGYRLGESAPKDSINGVIINPEYQEWVKELDELNNKLVLTDNIINTMKKKVDFQFVRTNNLDSISIQISNLIDKSPPFVASMSKSECITSGFEWRIEELINDGNGLWDEGEEFIDGNGIYDEGEQFIDFKNGIYDEGEQFIDSKNGIYDDWEEFTDGNGVWDEGEEFIDGNGVWDEGEEFIDSMNGVWDKGEEQICLEDIDICLSIEKVSDSSESKLFFNSNKKIASFEFSYSSCGIESVSHGTADGIGRTIIVNNKLVSGIEKSIINDIVDNTVKPIFTNIISPIINRAKETNFFTKGIIDRIKETKLYYSPEKITMDASIAESNQLQTMRTLDETETYSLDMTRGFSATYKIFDNFTSKYSLAVGSDLYHDMEKYNITRNEMLSKLNPGLVKVVNESFTNTYVPIVFDWFKPTFRYNPSYSWTLGNPSDLVQTSTIKNTNSFETKFDISPKEFMEIFFKPESNKSSNKRKRRGSSSKKNNQDKKDPIFKDINSPFLKSFLSSTYSLLEKISKIQFNYKISKSHTHYNVLANQHIDYNFKLGLIEAPNNISYSNVDGNLGSFAHSYSYDYRFSIPSISILPSVTLTSLEFKIDSSLTIQSTGVPSSNKTVSYYPLGVYGDQGLHLPSWGLTWSGLEKLDFIKNNFRSFKFSHNAKGHKGLVYQNGELIKNDYTLLFSPLIKLSSRTKGENPIDFELGSRYGLDIFYEGSSIEHDISTQIYSKIEYSRSKGMYIPIFFFRDLDLKNTVSFSFSADYEISSKLVAYEKIDNKDQLILDDTSNKISVSPKMSYQFSQWVNGNIFYKYILIDDISTGVRDEQDFGFNITIQIRG